MKSLITVLALVTALTAGISPAKAQDNPAPDLQTQLNELKDRMTRVESALTQQQERICTSMCGDITSFRYVYGRSAGSYLEAFQEMERSCNGYMDILFVAYQRNPLSYTLATVGNACR